MNDKNLVLEEHLTRGTEQSPLDLIIAWAKKERLAVIREMADAAERELYQLRRDRQDYQVLIDHHRKHHEDKQ